MAGMAMNSEGYFYTLAVLVALALCSTILRFAARRGAKKAKLWWDDAFIVVACVVLVAQLAVAGITYLHGHMGDPLVELLAEDKNLVTFFMKGFYVNQILYFFCMLPVKFSVLCLYLRVWKPYKDVVLAIKIAMGINILWFLGGLLPTAVRCMPDATPWSGTKAASACMNLGQLFQAITISNLLTDTLVLAIPIFAVKKLKLDRRRKITLAGLFLMGGLTCFCVLLRIIYEQVLVGKDVSKVAADCAFWLTAEPSVAIVAANLPCLKPLVPAQSPLSRISLLFSNPTGSRPSGSRPSHKRNQSSGSKSWFGSSKKGGIITSTRSMGTMTSGDDEDAMPLTALGGHQGQNRTLVTSNNNHTNHTSYNSHNNNNHNNNNNSTNTYSGFGHIDSSAAAADSDSASDTNVAYRITDFSDPYWIPAHMPSDEDDDAAAAVSDPTTTLERGGSVKRPARALSPSPPPRLSHGQIHVSKEFMITTSDRVEEDMPAVMGSDRGQSQGQGQGQGHSVGVEGGRLLHGRGTWES